MPFDRLKEGFNFDFYGMKTNLSADELPPSKYPYAKNIRQVDNIQTRPGYAILFATTIVINTVCPLDAGAVGVPYDIFLSALGSHSPYVWTLNSGTLPSGLTLTAAGEVHGTPTTPGTSNFVLRVTDSLGATTTKSCSMTVV